MIAHTRKKPSQSNRFPMVVFGPCYEKPDTLEYGTTVATLKEHCVPFAVSKRRAYEMTSYPKLVQRWLYWSRRAKTPDECWVNIVREGGRGQQLLIDFRSLRVAYERFLAGQVPPLMPSERRTK